MTELANYFAEHRGSQAELARELGVPQSVPCAWAASDPNKRRPIPLQHCPAIERFTGGIVSCEVLHPGAVWLRVPDPAWPHPGGRPAPDFVATREAAAEAANA